jgi:SAM-dependent methyltransferase
MQYPDFVARFYDVIYGALRSGVDHDYYLRRARDAHGPVLEVGVGTGRLFLDMLREGVDAYGIDLSPAMIDVLQGRLEKRDRHRVQVQDVRRLAWNRPFRLIVAPFRVLSHLVRIEDQLTALQRVREHLAPDGEFLFDLFVPDAVLVTRGMPPTVDFEGEWSPGHSLRRTTSVVPRPHAQINEVTMRFEWEEGGRVHDRSWKFLMRYFYRYEIEHLLARCGLEICGLCGDFGNHPLDEGSKEFVIHSRAKG